MRRVMASLVATVMALALIGGAGTTALAQEAGVPSLDGEFFFADEEVNGPFQSGTGAVTFSNVRCDPEGTSSFTVHASGTAFGPYPGTFVETVQVTIGPQTMPSGTGAAPVGRLVDLDARFTIDSPLGQVTGSKTLRESVEEGLNIGSCGFEPIPPDSSGNASPCTQTLHSLLGEASYEAQIRTDAGTGSDSGRAFPVAIERQLECPSPPPHPPHRQSHRYFSEYFVSERTANTPGKAIGGGQVDDVAFGFTAQSDATEDGEFEMKGECSVVDQTSAVKIHCTDVTEYIQVGNSVEFSGPARVNGEETTYRIEATDNTESGIGSDTFSIQTESGYSAGGVLTSGNIQVHPKALT